jgi:hypothetical protein
MIDSEGKVWNYKFPEKWHNTNSKKYLSIVEMKENFQNTDTVIMTIDKEVLSQYYGKLNIAAMGVLTELRNEMCDAGTTTYSGFIYDHKYKRYNVVLIEQWGDIGVHNKTSEAKELYSWLAHLMEQ